MNSGSFYMDIKYIPKFLLIKSLKLSSFVIIITVLIHIIRLYLVRYLLHVKNVKNLLFWWVSQIQTEYRVNSIILVALHEAIVILIYSQKNLE